MSEVETEAEREARYQSYVAEAEADYRPPASLAVSARVSDAVPELVTYCPIEHRCRRYMQQDTYFLCLFELIENVAAVAHERGFPREEAASLLLAATIKDATLYDTSDGLSEEEVAEITARVQTQTPALFRQLDYLEGNPAPGYSPPYDALAATVPGLRIWGYGAFQAVIDDFYRKYHGSEGAEACYAEWLAAKQARKVEQTAELEALITAKVEALNEAAARQAAEIEEIEALIEALKEQALEAIRAIGALKSEAPEVLLAKVEALNEVAEDVLDYAHGAECELEELENPREAAESQPQEVKRGRRF